MYDAVRAHVRISLNVWMYLLRCVHNHYTTNLSILQKVAAVAHGNGMAELPSCGVNRFCVCAGGRWLRRGNKLFS